MAKSAYKKTSLKKGEIMKNKLMKFFIFTIALQIVLPVLTYSETKGQLMLKAKRGAQVDAYRKLSELIKGINVSSNTYVRDFVTESDEIRIQFNDFIQGAKVLGPPKFIEEADGSYTAQVDVKVTLEQVLQGLAQISYNRGPNKPPLDLTYMKNHTRKKEFIATGTSNTGVNIPLGQSAVARSPKKYGTTRKSHTTGLAGWENVTGQGRLKAERAALTDARRNLAETVEGLRITGNTYVRDFVIESDEIRTSLNAFIKGVKKISPYRYYDNAIVEVDVQVTIEDVIRELTTVQQHFQKKGFMWQNDLFRNVTFDKITRWADKKVITATGTGTVHEADYFDRAGSASINSSNSSIPASWSGKTITAVGVGILAQGQTGASARVNAERAAEMDARRNLVEQLYGVQINSQTTVRDFVLQNDRVNADVTAFLSGARKVGEPVYNDDGSVEVTVEIALDQLWELINR